MGLAQGIVIVNEYTINKGGKGSRGSTPGDYVTNYMSRGTATETLTPVKLTEQEDYITRYMTRKDAVELIDDKDKVKPEFKSIQKYGGVAFGYGSISLSDEKLKFASKDIQAQFDKGKTVMKTVLSFNEEYLRNNKIIPDGFVCKKAGDYRGNIDQMKLRMGIMHGLDALAKDYDDLQYVGVIQVDTKHVHCHLAMVDRGDGNITADGTQKGKLSAGQKAKLRRHIDMYLDETKSIQHMSSNVTMDKRNTAIFVKQVCHRTMEQNGMSQLLLACLPDDKRLWHASTHSKSMEKANTLTRDYVRELFAQPDSGYDKVHKSIQRYAETRRDKEDLSHDEYQTLIRNGEKRVEDECVNAVYGMLQNINKRDKRTHTPMLDLMAMPAQDISKDTDEFGEFTYKLRSYSTRLDYHKKERDKAHKIRESYEEAKEKGVVSTDAQPLYDFFKFEEEYNEKLMCKYQHFLRFLPPSDKYDEDLKELLDYRQKVNDVDGMFHDKTIKRMTGNNAEEYAERVYGQSGGRYMTTCPEVIETRLEHMRSNLEKKDKDFAYKISVDALTIDLDSDEPKFKRQVKYPFDEVKALDIHHLNYDSSTDMKVSKKNAAVFIEIARRRAELAEAAKAYLVASGQRSELENINMRDIRLMTRVADRMEKKPEIESKRADEKVVKPVRTTSLSKRFDMSIPVKQSLIELQMNEDDDITYGHRKFR